MKKDKENDKTKSKETGKILQLVGLGVLALVLMKIGCLCQERQDKDLLTTAAQMSAMHGGATSGL